ncbi:MAG: hypothetical protein Q7O66_16740 [Dehalococcoidia bacterium]|nr:hypothetical protein [Dehalococcoidia bacterium]
MAATEAYLQELIRDRQEVYGPLHEQIKANRALRYRKHSVDIPEAYKLSTKEIKVPIVADMLFRVVATLTTDEPQITVAPYSVTEKAKRNASLRERWSLASLDEMMRGVSRDVFRMGIDAAVSDSLGVWKLIDRRDAWKGFPKRGDEEDAIDYLDRADKFAKSAPFPFYWTDIDGLTYLPVHGAYGVTEVVEVSTRPAIPAMKEFGVFRPSGAKGFSRRRQPGEPMADDDSYSGEHWQCAEHWTANSVTYMLDNEIVDQRKLNYGRVPYFECGGHTTSSRKPEERYQSVIQPFAHLVPALDAILSMMTNWGYFAGYPFLVQDDPNVSMTQGPTDPTTVTQIKPGAILRNVRFLEAPQTSKALGDLVQIINMMIDRSGLAAVMYGQGASSSSGYMVSQLMTAAQLVYSPIVKNARMALAQMIPFLWQLIERRIRRKVYVWGTGTGKGQSEWLGLGPDDIDGYYACNVDLKPLLPMDEIAQRDSALRMTQGGLWSEEHAREHTGLAQPEEEADQIAVEQYMKRPEVNQPILEDAARRAGLIKPQPPTPAGPQPPVILGPDGQPLPPSGQGVGGPGMPPIAGMQPQVPGVNLPLVPPAPQTAGAGGPPVGLQRQPGGNFGPPPGGTI